MRKFISFSVFALVVVVLSLAAENVEAQFITRKRAVIAAPLVVKPVCPGPGYVWVNNGWAMRRNYRSRGIYGYRWHARPYGRYRIRW